MKWRLIIDNSPRDAFENMALDYALLHLSKVPTLRLYKWSPSAVSIGRFQSLKEEVNLGYCYENKIDFTRRITGGGAVFHDKEITYSLVISEDNPYFSKELKKSYEIICGAVMLSLSTFGLNSSFSGINDVLVNGKKISGCAQTRKNNNLLHHGTLLVDLDKNKMFNALRVDRQKISGKGISFPEQRVTSLTAELDRKISDNEVIKSLILGFSKKFNITFFLDKFSEEEIKLMKKTKKDVFENELWIYER